VTQSTRKPTIPFPREHGAWGILYGAYFAALAISNQFSVSTLLFIFSITLFYMARQPMLNLFRKKDRPFNLKWFFIFSLSGGIFLLLTAYVTHYWSIIGYTLIMAVFFLIELWLIRNRKQMTFGAQLTGTIGLTIVAPLTLILLQKQVSPIAILLWLISILFFTSGLLFVRYQIALTTKNKRAITDKKRYRTAIILYHLLLFIFLIGLPFVENISGRLILAFLPLLVHIGLSLSNRVVFSSLKTVGWLEILQTIIFVGLLFWIF